MTATRRTFTKPPAAPKPTLICAGKVTEVKDAYLSAKSQKYYVVPIQLTGMDGGLDQKVYWLFHPEFFKGYTPSELIELAEDDKGAYRIFCQHIAQESGKVSHLQGLATTEEAFDEISSRLLSLGVDAITENPTLVSDTLREFLIDENGDNVVGYVLRQQQEATDEKDENGKTIYVPSKWMEVGGYWEVNDKNVKKQAEKAAKSKGKVKMTYSGVPY